MTTLPFRYPAKTLTGGDSIRNIFLVALSQVNEGMQMPGRKKLLKEVSGYHRSRIERQVALLEIAMTDASIGVSPFCPHGEAIKQLRKDLRVAVNLLNNRPSDYLRPNCHMSASQTAAHDEFERKAREGTLTGDENYPKSSA